MLNSMKESPSFYPCLVVYHILSETEIWPFLRLLHKNSSEMQLQRSTQSRTKELNRLLLSVQFSSVGSLPMEQGHCLKKLDPRLLKSVHKEH